MTDNQSTTAERPLRAHSPEVSAARARRWGSFFYAEQVLRVMRNYGWSVILYSVGQPVAYLFAMGVGLASLVDANSEAAFGGVSYLEFVAPALLVSAAVMTASGEFSYPIMDGFKWRRVFYGPHASPLIPQQIASGHIMASSLRFLLQSVVYFVVVALFGASPSPWGWVSAIVATVAALSFGLPLMAYAASITQDKGQFALVQRFIVMPLFLFSGTFFPLDSLPIAVRWIGWISPVWHGTELGRVFTYGMDQDPLLTITHIVFLLVTAVVGWVLVRRQFVKRMGS
ncbi:lipooligosaccharide transport system permease protein [Pseudarthrobacter sp. PvP004]|uniref:ABC transporter permease n=1 Tax=Pseudarthrobacter sp. PvP004 TaxID=2817850 RepID=UPI001AEA2297|nr:ABC transporter permease [Pseudarthrobacter sp. PvP004]MBP2266969.1 lipooligosaccharide transport system permease protein [Pseudarthrobacter sp. PvP004]